MKTYISYFDENQIKEYNLKADRNTVLFKGNDTSMEGKNINDLNTFYCELCTFYWVWKNTDDELLCFKQYRRPFDTDIVPKEGEIVCYAPISIRDPIYLQYGLCHGSKRAIDVLTAMIGLYGESSREVRYWKYCNVMYTNNTMVIHRKDFDKMCEFVFSTLFRLDKLWKLNKDFTKYEENAKDYTEDGKFDYQKHFMAYIGERLISAYIFMNLNSIEIKRLENNGDFEPYKPKEEKK